MDNLKVLCDVYGSRFPGTPGDIGSVKYMVEKLTEYGLDASYDEFRIPGWTRGPATLEVTSPVKRSFEVISLPHSVAGEVETELVDLGAGHIDVYEKRRDEIEGKIVMVSGAKPPGMAKNPHRTEKFNRSILAGARGWIFTNRSPGKGQVTGGVSPIVPAIGTTFEDGEFLRRLVKREGSVKVRIKTSDRNHDVTTHNVIADLHGTGNSKEYVATGSHYDAHDISPGAYDPASGCVMMMEMARALALSKGSLKRRIRFLFFGAEETGLFGSYNYTETHELELADCRFYLNLDCAGGPGKKGIKFHDYPELTEFTRRVEAEINSEMPTSQGVSSASDHWPFFLKGVPSGAGDDPSRPMGTGDNFIHTKYDTLDKLNVEDMRLGSVNYARFLLRVANADVWDVKRKTPEDIQETIRKLNMGAAISVKDNVYEVVAGWDDLHPDTVEWLKDR
jgi:Iap family predicted aminopeptidase